jgi:hypothetical protein
MVRASFADLLDQKTPFGRLALVHVVMTAGDTLLTVSLAGSLFFSISLHAAKNQVILYLLLTMAPFAVVAPLLGPVIDRSRGARRATVVASAACRAVVCLIMADGLKSLLIFPEAFTMLVLSKVYLVTKGSLVPLLIGNPVDTGPGRLGGPSTPVAPAPVDGDPYEPESAARYGITDAERQNRGATPPGDPGAYPPDGPEGSVDHNRLATANAQLGLLASLTAFAASLPAIAVLKLLGGPWVLRLDMVVFVVGTVLALRLPIRRASRAAAAATPPVPSPPVASPTARPDPSAAVTATTPSSSLAAAGPLAALRPAPSTHPEVTFALTAMSVLKFSVGFLTFLLAFDLRRAHATIWYGPTIGLSIAGAVVGVLLVPRARRVFSEPQVLTLAVWLVALTAAVTAVVGGVVIQALLAFVIGLAGGAGKPAFDALAQRYVPTEAQGRGFARFETRLQLVWVVGALLPVVTTTALVSGDVVIAAVAGFGGLSYMTGRRAVRHLRPTAP